MKTLKQQLAALTYQKACLLLGDNGEDLLRKGGFYEIDIVSQLSSGQHIFWLNLPEASVTISAGKDNLNYSCSECLFPCEHTGAALAIILEEKENLGLIDISQHADLKHGGELIKRALSDRRERAQKEDMQITSLHDTQSPWGDYRVLSYNSGKTYKIALRGLERGQSYCSCPDYKCNTLGTCKHLLFAQESVKDKYSTEALQAPYKRTTATVHMLYSDIAELKVSLPSENAPEPLLEYSNSDVTDTTVLMKAIQESIALGYDVNIYPDAAEYIDSSLFKKRMSGLVTQIHANPQSHPLRTSLLKKPLLSYQLEAIGFAAGRGRVLIADDMGLGKTVQGIGTAELLRQEAGIKKVLIIAPASLKIQWHQEINEFCDSTKAIIQGSAEDRSHQYTNEQFYSICNYEQVLKDFPSIQKVKWDLIILDEGQRIKNFESQTSKVIKSLKSTYALVLSGTPLENRLEELFSVVNFVDNMILGPAFQFFEDYTVKDEKGKLTAYKNLDTLREKLKPIMLRRTRAQVLPELPPIFEETRLIPATEDQLAIDIANRRIMQSIISKSRISEMDLLRLRKAMTSSRMAADCSSLVNKHTPSSSAKLEEFKQLIEQLNNVQGTQVLVFSEWNKMLDLIGDQLTQMGISFSRIDGTLNQNQKELVVEGFNNSHEMMILLCSNTAATGLNLQKADTVINFDIPWNPAKLEQRAARAHRMGQRKPVHVINLVTADSIEERLLNNFEKKTELFTAALDSESDICEITMSGGMNDLRSKLQTLLSTGDKKRRSDTIIALKGANPDNISLSGGRLLTSALHFLADMLQTDSVNDGNEGLSRELRRLLMHSFKRNENGELEITLRFADDEAIDRLASALSRLSNLGINRAGQ